MITLPCGDKYAEGAHIKPLGVPHDGPDIIQNILCLCPNHHLMFDRYSYSINPVSLKIQGAIKGELKLGKEHAINRDYLLYHWENYTKHRYKDRSMPTNEDEPYGASG